MKPSRMPWEPIPFNFDLRRGILVYKTLALQEDCLNTGLLTRVYTEGQMYVMKRQDLKLLRDHYRHLLSVLTNEV